MGFNAPDCTAPIYGSLKKQEDIDPESDAEKFKKMPVSYLQEWCGRKKVTPIYHIRASEGQVHEPTFVYSVMVEDITGMGRGRNKKMAKHYAALDALHKIIQCGRYEEWFQCKTPEEAYELMNENIVDLDSMPGGNNEYVHNTSDPAAAEVSDDLAIEGTGAVNPIGKLSEICRVRHWPQPDYQQVSETGMPHEKTFVIKVVLGLFSKEGVARTKKLAKKFAAEAMIKFLNEIPLEERDRDLALEEEVNNEDEDDTQNVVVPSGDLDADLSNLAQQKDGVDVIESQAIVDGQFIFNGFGGTGCAPVKDKAEQTAATTTTTITTKNSDNVVEKPVPECLKKLADFDIDVEKPGPKHKKLLEDVCQETGRTVVFRRLERKSKDGKWQCMLDFGKDEASVGKGETYGAAEIAAAIEALDILKQNLI